MKNTARQIIEAANNEHQQLYVAPLEGIMFWSIPEYIGELEESEKITPATVEVFETDTLKALEAQVSEYLQENPEIEFVEKI